MSDKPRILTLDIETAPTLAYVWGLFDQNIGLNQVKEPGRVIMVGMKWLGEEVQVVDEYRNPEGMWESTYNALCQADAVITYNGNRFDIPKLNGHFLKLGYDPLPQITSIDLLRAVKKLGLLSNKLDYAAGYLGIGHKIQHEGFPLWTGWMQGDDKCVAKMRRYCAQDVKLTEKLYKTIRGYIPNHPYLGRDLHPSKFECPHCGAIGKKAQHRGYYRTKAARVERIQCMECGSWSKGKRELVK